jgi:hypothetical protein
VHHPKNENYFPALMQSYLPLRFSDENFFFGTVHAFIFFYLQDSNVDKMHSLMRALYL